MMEIKSQPFGNGPFGMRTSNTPKASFVAELVGHTGQGLDLLMHAKKDYRPEYVYWDDSNELVDRLCLFTASYQAGNTEHANEIMSILEEPREADLIE